MVVIANVLEMESFGKKIAALAKPGLVIYLEGELGAGKTTFVRGFLRGFGYLDHVRSPTYNLFEIYEVKGQVVCHMDLYRLKDPEEVVYFGVMDYFDNKNICLIEWPEKGRGFLPKGDVLFKFDFTENPDERVVDIKVLSSNGNDVVKA